MTAVAARGPTGRRRTELGLLVLAAVVVASLYVLASLGRNATLPADVGPFLAVVIVLWGVTHVAVRRLAPGADPTLIPLVGLLNGIGYVFIARLDQDLAALQATWTAVGVAAFVGTLVLVRHARDLARYRWTFALGGVVLLLLPLVPGIGSTIRGARLWVSLGPVNFQPGELAKVALAVFFAGYLVENRELLGTGTTRLGPVSIPDLKHLGPVFLAWGGSLVVMIAERDLGTSLLFFALFVVMLWVATGRAAWLWIGSGLFATGALVAYQLFDHVQDRVRVWLDPWSEAADAGFQIVQSAFAFAWGGIIGAGPGLGNPGIIPVVETDFIFAAIGEELGLVGSAGVLAAFLLLVAAGFRIAVGCRSPYEKLLATGLTVIIGVQTFIIIGGVTRVVPLTGITLPFVSYGGSSLVANYVLLALLVRLSHDAADRPDPAAART